jgi:hypothetical protein
MMIDPTLRQDLSALETLITKNEGSAIRARWEYGRKILALYAPGKKQLPNGVLDAIAGDLGAQRSEVSARIKFAKKFPTEAEVSTAIETFGSWWAIKQTALTDKPRPKVSKSTRSALQHAFEEVEAIDPATAENDDLALIEEFIALLRRLGANIVTLKAA